MRNLLLIFCVFFLCVTTAVAQTDTDSFTVQVYGNIDATPPSTPTLLSAIPIATTQIDLAWTAATDNYIVAGYSILRDGLPIATTSLLSYSDTGLAASTTYSYTVRAFDTSLNYSSTSNALATTTPSIPSPLPEEGSGRQESTAARVVLDELTIETGISTTSFSLLTTHQARLELRWGRSASYELGYVVRDVFSKDHAIFLTDLEPGTSYEYEVIGYTPAGFQSVLERGTFTTLDGSPAQSPPNVGRFTAVGIGDDVSLSWDVPEGESIAYVRVVRSHLRFPEHPQDGAIVYQGLQGVVRDENVFASYSPVHYTAFVFDSQGNVSSGVVALVYADTPPWPTTPSRPGTPTLQTPVDLGGTLATTTDEATSTIEVGRLTVEMKLPELSDILLTQHDTIYSFIDPTITIDASYSFTISLPKASVAGNLKSIIATIVDPTDNRKRYSYLLRINKDRSAYEAQIAPSAVAGKSTIVVEIYDYEAFVVGSYQTPVEFKEAVIPVAEEVIFPDVLFERWLLVLFALGSVLLLIFIILLIKRIRHEDNL